MTINKPHLAWGGLYNRGNIGVYTYVFRLVSNEIHTSQIEEKRIENEN